ncbi:uncharacterized protein LOC131682689 [Topomyia yanbarensis]|uniref:uncharacterized protein LOC131682689 n=1 Tax=Topomyia yanbarensis TaxID=2498891 RepID=UPI00273BA812|nr:uncharacterized protein LOC131682689 [Topomyia yanbarensis]
MTSEVVEDLRCRVCLETEVNELMSLFCVASTQKMLLAHMVLACTGVPISTLDQLPQLACDGCVGKLDVAYACWKRCRQSWGNYKRNPVANGKDDDYCCRICLKQDAQEFVSLFCICDKHLLKISEIIKQYAGLDITENDEFPQYICNECLIELNVGFNFKLLCQRSNRTLRRQLPQNYTVTLSEDIRANITQQYQSSPEIPLDTPLDGSPAPEPRTVEVPPALKTPIIKKTQQSGGFKTNTTITKQVSHPSIIINPARKIIRPAKVHMTTTISKTVAVDRCVKTSPPKQSKVLSFSTPREFKKLASTIVPKSKFISTLTPCRFKVLSNEGRYSVSQITTFTCSACQMHYTLNEIREKCIKCNLPFKNFTPFKTNIKPTLGKPHASFCCNQCSYFSSTHPAMVNHLKQHDKKAPVKKKTSPPSPITQPAEIKEEMECVIEPEVGTDPLATTTTTRRQSIDTEEAFEGFSDVPAAKKSKDCDTFDVIIELDSSDDLDAQMQEMFGLDESQSTTNVPIASNNELDNISSMNSGSDVDQDVRGYESDSVSDSEENRIDSKIFDLLQETEHYLLLFLNGTLCCGCLRLFESPEDLNLHHKTAHIQRRFNIAELNCTICKTICNAVHEIGMHRLLASKKIFYFCKICSQLLISDADFEDHRISEHPTVAARPSEADSFVSPNMLVTRLDETSALTELDAKLTADDNVTFDVIKETDTYQVLYLKCYLCCNCNRMYRSKLALQVHCVEYHQVHKNQSAPNQCDKCHTTFKTESQLVRHQLRGAKKMYYSCKLCRNIVLENEVDFEMHCAARHSKMKTTAKLLDPTEKVMMLIQKQQVG